MKNLQTKKLALLKYKHFVRYVVFLLDVRIKATKKLAHYKYELMIKLW